MSSTIEGPATGPVSALDVEARATEWLWPFGASSDPDVEGPQGLIPKRQLSVLAGKRDRGKNVTLSHIVADLSRHGIRTLISAPEDDRNETLRPRLEAAGADLSMVKFWDFALMRDFDELTFLLVTEQIGYLIMDPFAAHLTDGVKRHSDNVRDVLTPLTKLIRDLGLGCTVVDHVLKNVPRDGDLHDAIGGNSSGLVAASRMAFLVGRDPKDNDHVIMGCVKHNITRDDVPCASFTLDTRQVEVLDPKTNTKRMDEFPYLVYQGEIEFDVRRLISNEKANRRGPAADRLEAAEKFLVDYLYAAGQPVPSGQLKEDALARGFSWRTTRRAADQLGVVRSSKGRGCKWSLPDKLRETLDAQRQADSQLGDGFGVELDENGMLNMEDFERLLNQPPPEQEDDEPEDEHDE